MTTVTHAYTVAIGDRAEDAAAGKVLPSHWNADHTVSYAGGTVTASAPIIDATQTWNNAAVSFAALRLNVTDTASASGSLLLDLKVGGSSIAYIDKYGQFTTTYRVNTTTVFLAGIVVAAGAVKDTNKKTICAGFSNDGDQWFGGRGFLFFDPSDGSTVRGHLESAATGEIEVNNGTTATYRDLRLRNLLAGGGNGSYVQTPSMTVTNLAAAGTAGAGARAFVTDATATTFLSVVAGGGANKVPVVSDGTNWLIG